MPDCDLCYDSGSLGGSPCTCALGKVRKMVCSPRKQRRLDLWPCFVCGSTVICGHREALLVLHVAQLRVKSDGAGATT